MRLQWRHKKHIFLIFYNAHMARHLRRAGFSQKTLLKGSLKAARYNTPTPTPTTTTTTTTTTAITRLRYDRMPVCLQNKI